MTPPLLDVSYRFCREVAQRVIGAAADAAAVLEAGTEGLLCTVLDPPRYTHIR